MHALYLTPFLYLDIYQELFERLTSPGIKELPLVRQQKV